MLGIKAGENVHVHRTAQFFGGKFITLGSNVRIDCFCVITAREPVRIGNNVHIAVGSCIFGSEGVDVGSFANLSGRVSIYTSSDDYSEGYLTNPTVENCFKKTKLGKVQIEDHVIIGAGSVVMPGLVLRRGAAVGALSFVNNDVDEFLVVAGIPIRKIGFRDKDRLEALEHQFFRGGTKEITAAD